MKDDKDNTIIKKIENQEINNENSNKSKGNNFKKFLNKKLGDNYKKESELRSRYARPIYIENSTLSKSSASEAVFNKTFFNNKVVDNIGYKDMNLSSNDSNFFTSK